MIAGLFPMANAGQQSDANGFIQGSQLVLTNRNYLFNHDFKGGVWDGRDWAHALLFSYTSGFTQGTVGLGVDAIENIILKLDEQGNGTGNLHRNHDDETESFTHFGMALKARVSNTVIKYGTQSPVSPMLADIGSRIQPLTAYGLNVMSKEIAGLDLEAAHFTGSTGWNSSSRKGPLKAFYANVDVDSIDYAGATYKVNDALSVSLYAAYIEDLWRQYYSGAIYTLPLSKTQSLNVNFNLYRTLDEGQAVAGDINNTAWSLAASYTWGAHRLTLARQQIHGDVPMDYIGQGNENSPSYSIYLANSAQTSDFNAPGEKSTQIRYDLDMANFGVPGLTLTTRYIYGDDVDGTQADPRGAYAGKYGAHGSEREYGVQVGYVVQSGPAKDLAIQVRQYFHRGDDLGLASDQFRLMISHPLSLF
ncbi:OprD family porin [Pseudomonas sp. C2L12B]|nr:OprD family porin [Pseudomonas typographi]